MLNHLNQLEAQAKAHTHQLRQEAEVERQLRGHHAFNWAAPVLNIVAPLGRRPRPKVRSYR